MGKVRLNLMDAFEYLINDRTCGLWRAVDTNWCGVYSGKKKKKLVWGTILNERQGYRLRQPFSVCIYRLQYSWETFLVMGFSC